MCVTTAITVVARKKQLKEVLCFTGEHEQRFAWITKYGITTRHMNQHQFLLSVFFSFLCDLENKKIEEALKSGKT